MYPKNLKTQVVLNRAWVINRIIFSPVFSFADVRHNMLFVASVVNIVAALNTWQLTLASCSELLHARTRNVTGRQNAKRRQTCSPRVYTGATGRVATQTGSGMRRRGGRRRREIGRQETDGRSSPNIAPGTVSWTQTPRHLSGSCRCNKAFVTNGWQGEGATGVHLIR